MPIFACSSGCVNGIQKADPEKKDLLNTKPCPWQHVYTLHLETSHYNLNPLNLDALVQDGRRAIVDDRGFRER